MENYNTSSTDLFLSTPSYSAVISNSGGGGGIGGSSISSSANTSLLNIMNRSNDEPILTSMTNATLTPEPAALIYWNFKALASFLGTYFTPVITIAGTIGNFLSVFVFLRTKLKKLTSSYYLAFLAICDTLFLWCYFIEWLNLINIDLYKRNGFCQLFNWLSNTCSVLSVWLVVAFTIERFVAVMYPLKRQSMYTARRARCIVCFLVIFNAISSSPLLLFTGSIRSPDDVAYCIVEKKYTVSISNNFIRIRIMLFLCDYFLDIYRHGVVKMSLMQSENKSPFLFLPLRVSFQGKKLTTKSMQQQKM